MKTISLKLFLAFVFISSILPALAQRGTIKIFSEIVNVEVFLDEEFIGFDIKTIDSVAIGSHYLKVIKDSIAIYGEVVNVNENAVTTILIKNTKEIQNKLLEDKADIIKQYKEQRLDVLISTRYITETSTESQSKYYPGYYSSTGKTESNTVSETVAVTDWFITQGQNKISENTFATITNNQIKLDEMALSYETVKKKRTKKSILAPLFLGAAIYGLVKFIVPVVEDNSFQLLPLLVYFGGFGGFIGMIASMPQYRTQFYTIDEVKSDAEKYNQELKMKLGLPESYEPD